MKIEVVNYGGHRIYRKKSNYENVIFNVYCFLCGFVLAMIIALMI